MLRVSLITLAFIAGAVSASAQSDDDWWEAYQATSDIENTALAIDKLNELEASASTDIMKSVAQYSLGSIYHGQGQYGQAATQWEKAHSLYLGQDEPNDDLYNAITKGLINVYIRANRNEDAERIALERTEILKPDMSDL